MDKKKRKETANRKRKTNDILEDHGDWLLVDISTPKFHDATMAVDTDVFQEHEGGRIWADCKKSSKYIYARYHCNQRKMAFHHDVIDYQDGFDTDHIKHGSMTFVDNRKSNLRIVTSKQNAMNKSVYYSSKSGITGVRWDKSIDKWKVQIMVEGKNKHLGYFDNIDFAIGARQQAEREYFGEYAFGSGGM